MTDPVLLAIEVVYALPERAWSTTVRVSAPATVGQALELARMETKVPGLAPIDPTNIAVYGRTVTLDSPLHDGDRIEILPDPGGRPRRRGVAAPGSASRRREATAAPSLAALALVARQVAELRISVASAWSCSGSIRLPISSARRLRTIATGS